jgi:hypothetical protein
LENGSITDSQLSASSYRAYMYVSRLGRSYNMEAKHGRLNNKLAWCGLGPFKDIRPVSYLQVDFGEVVNVTGLATQGFDDINSYYVKTYELGFSLNGNDWFNYSSPNKVGARAGLSRKGRAFGALTHLVKSTEYFVPRDVVTDGGAGRGGWGVFVHG